MLESRRKEVVDRGTIQPRAGSDAERRASPGNVKVLLTSPVLGRWVAPCLLTPHLAPWRQSRLKHKPDTILSWGMKAGVFRSHSPLPHPFLHIARRTHLPPPSCRKLPGLGPCHRDHSPNAGTRCRPWRPSGAQWGLRAEASCTPAAETQRRMTAGKRAATRSLTALGRSRLGVSCLQRGHLPNGQPLPCTPFHPSREEAHWKESRRRWQASPPRSVSSSGKWRL